MANVKQLLEAAFKEMQYEIEVISFDSTAIDPATFESMEHKLRFQIGNHRLSALTTNADDSDSDIIENYAAEIAAIALESVKDEIITTFIDQNTRIKPCQPKKKL